jgi:hypothetical protein
MSLREFLSRGHDGFGMPNAVPVRAARARSPANCPCGKGLQRGGERTVTCDTCKRHGQNMFGCHRSNGFSRCDTDICDSCLEQIGFSQGVRVNLGPDECRYLSVRAQPVHSPAHSARLSLLFSGPLVLWFFPFVAAEVWFMHATPVHPYQEHTLSTH